MSTISANQAKKLAEIVEATTDAARGFVYMTEKSVKVLVDAGYAECNKEITDGAGNIAVRATKAGLEYGTAPAATEEEGTTTMNTEATAVRKFPIIKNIKLPAISRAGAAKSDYDFDELETGDGFFVPATEKMPNPGKSLASTVSSASKRYATENGTREINRKVDGVMTKVTVPAYVYERKFVVRSVKDGADYGYPGVSGAVVSRIDPADHEDGDDE